SSNTGVVTVTVTGSSLTITETGIGSSVITVTASDGEYTVDETFTVTVENVNEPPVVQSPLDDLELDEGFGTTTVNLAGVFSDPDGDELTLSVVNSNTSVVTVTLTGNILTINEAGFGSSTITVTATDDGTPVLSTDETFTVTVINVNDPPVVANPIADRTYNERFATASVSLAAVFSDPDGDELTLSAVSSNTGVVTVAVTGSTLTINETGIGSSVITVTASDGEYTVDETFTVTVNNVNDPPVVDNPLPDVVLDEDFGTFNVNLSDVFSDEDGDPLTLSAFSSNSAVVTVSVSGTALTITERGLGTSVVTVTASDGSLSVDEQFGVTVNNVNDPPEVISPISNQVLNEHFGTLSISLAGVFSDPDDDVLLLTATSSDPSVVTVSVSGTNLVVTERGLGTAEITVTASDGELSVSDRFTVVVNNVNDAPVVVSPISSISRNEGF
ncbi:MAG: tandem-95 repeat protein, partial [Actinobacteria bacterium]|nr:tandem-95 repeat protein [Actinomycetota bacterium]